VDRGYVEFYDLDVAGHHSYFVEKVLVHNCHMTSKDFQNAMLKPLEDTPDHVYFFLCTTNPEKLIPAIKTRCAEVQFSTLESRYISLLVKRVSRQEGIELDQEVIEEIIDASQGSARSALVILEKISKLGKEQALKLLRSHPTDLEMEGGKVLDLCQALTRKDGTWGDVASVLKEVYEEESDLEKIRYQVLGYAASVLLRGKGGNRAALIIECFSQPFYDTGRAGVTLACYQSMTLGK
jgi:DNA polymerase-3 subunit gamma/tau